MTTHHLAFQILKQTLEPKPHLLVLPDHKSAEYTFHMLHYWLHQHQPAPNPAQQSALPSLYWFSDWETLPYDTHSPHPDLIAHRLRTLSDIRHSQALHHQSALVVCSVKALSQRLTPPSHFDRHGIHIAIHDTLEQSALLNRLQQAGYQKTVFIANKGEYATKGSVVDLFPLNADYPIRIEFMDNRVESLRYVDLTTQQTLNRVSKILLLPRSELDLSDRGRICYRQSARHWFGEKVQQSALYQQISEHKPVQGLDYYLPLFFDETSSLLDYLPHDTKLWLCDDAWAQAERFYHSVERRYERLNPHREHPLLPPEAVFQPPKALWSQLEKLPPLHLKALCTPIVFQGNAKARLEQWQAFQLDPRPIICHSQSEGKRELLEEKRYLPKALCLVSPLRHSFETQEEIHLSEWDLSEHPIYHTRPQTNPEQALHHLGHLQLQEPLIHRDYGIGRYGGLTQLEDDGEEMLTLHYAKGTTVYLPLTDFDLISKYHGDPESAPLHELGGKVWQKLKSKMEQNVHDTAAELLELYAKREQAQGLPIPTPESLSAFSAEFPFEETEDQMMAIDAVIQDLAKSRPMDRMVCGDVGFGKTEVAIRAAYIAAQAGFQTAVIAPTTLLAEQHASTFRDRFSNTAITLESLSRFKTKKEQQSALERLQDGRLDIVIGTHRLLQKDVQFKNLGLVIIDEEQRFGVKHKETLKALRENINLLTLTATPIPRTLNLALSGLRDLSLITTAPKGRRPIHTHWIGFDWDVIAEACERELARGGQVYFLHNDIQTIERQARMLQELLPQARIVFAHGQMPERELETIMHDFENHHYDLLLTTTIIESGIDIPNANTIIINHADKLGLSQLHQLRGRVGRSHHQAYAYLMTPEPTTLNKNAQRRLEAFVGIESLGAGFVLASQDLDIRGAGEILGSEQSGISDGFGLSYYLDLLERTIARLKKGEMTLESQSALERCQFEHFGRAMVPEDYVFDPQIRLQMYHQLARTQSALEREQLKALWINQFGKLPQEAENLISKTALKQQAEQMGITKIHLTHQAITLTIGNNPQFDRMKLFVLMQQMPQQYRLLNPHQVRMQHQHQELSKVLGQLATWLQEIG
ncbi:MAG: transcription-repair coupling factor [Cardiobacteriaceae bacterium]|nr:transcription-repair coupling factor [Cardiobacteriaceae bacterium]